jgi:hypothetical protein
MRKLLLHLLTQHGWHGIPGMKRDRSLQKFLAPWEKIKPVPEYKFGWRWEPSQYAVFALTYGNEINGNNGAGFEFGVMLFYSTICMSWWM